MINEPVIVEEVRLAFLRYEAALLANDIPVLNAFFLDSVVTVRYGVSEQSYGIGAIRSYREQAPPVNPARKLRNTVITSFGHDAASVCTEFIVPGENTLGRQTQTWIRQKDGWKIVAAHISTVPL